MVLGKLQVPVQGPIALVIGAGGGCWTFLLSSVFFSSLSPSLWGTARYRLKYCLKGPLNPKQPTNIYVYTKFQHSSFKRKTPTQFFNVNM